MGQTDSKKKLGRFELRVSEDDQDVAYLRLPSHPGETCKMSKSIRLAELMGSYTSPPMWCSTSTRMESWSESRSWRDALRPQPQSCSPGSDPQRARCSFSFMGRV